MPYAPRRLVTPEGLPTANPDEAIPADPDERLVFARRLVADRCLYGVDKNPLAAEMAKLSLWLITLAKGRPFSFLDHALRAGDSLLGIADLEQLTRWSLRMDRANPNLDWVTGPVEKALRRAFALRREIRTLPTLDARDADLKREKLAQAKQTMALVRLGADLLVAAALAPDAKAREERRGRFLSRYAMLLRAADEGRDTAALEAELRADAEALLQGRRPFHWPLEFPEVFDPSLGERPVEELLAEAKAELFRVENTSQGFTAIVGNPPFMGGSKITGTLGTTYRDLLVDSLAYNRRGSADLCAYFLLQSSKVIGASGTIGMIVTNSIAQGDTRDVGLAQMTNSGFSIPMAFSSRTWPGLAAVEVALIWIVKDEWKGKILLDGSEVHAITSSLTSEETDIQPKALRMNDNLSFTGNKPYGQGFVLTQLEALSLINADMRNKEVVFPYLNGEELNSSPDQSPSRWIINFGTKTIEEAAAYKECFARVESLVKPYRATVNRAHTREKWWLHEHTREELYSNIADLHRVIVKTQVSRTWAFCFIPRGIVYDQRLIVFASDNATFLAALQSDIHFCWALRFASTLKQG